jgi:DNA polymerase epsilon subunit 2
MLPRPPLPLAFTARFRAKVPRAHFTSNPCRIKFFGQEIVIIRQDLMDRMLANLIGVKPDLTATDTKRYVRTSLYSQQIYQLIRCPQLVQTIVDQCHLSPLPLSVQPINWQLDHALRLYPMPTTVCITLLSESCPSLSNLLFFRTSSY